MKQLLVLPVISLLVPSLKAIPVKFNDFTKIEIPPLSYVRNATITVQGIFQGQTQRSCKVEVINSVYPLGKEIYRELSNNGLYDFQFQLSYLYTSPDMCLRFTENRSKVSVDIYPKFSIAPVINIEEDTSSYLYRNITRYTHDKGITYASEKYEFRGFESFYVLDYYHKLDLSIFKIKVGNESLDSLTYESALFYIFDPYELFDELSQYKTGEYIVIPLKLVKGNDNYYSLTIQNDIYVNPSTLKMSFLSKEDYVKTRHIYLPINQKRYEETYRFGLTILDVGYNLAYINYSFTIKSYKNLVGDCVNSQYCIGISSSNERNNL